MTIPFRLADKMQVAHMRRRHVGHPATEKEKASPLKGVSYRHVEPKAPQPQEHRQECLCQATQRSRYYWGGSGLAGLAFFT